MSSFPSSAPASASVILPSPTDARVGLAFAADIGTPGAAQTALVGRFDEWQAAGLISAVLLGGDNNYGGSGGFSAAWAAWAPRITAGTVYAALGNHDIDGTGTWTSQVALLPHLPGNRRYYSTTFGNGLVELFVLHSGLNTARQMIEPDGASVGSVQHGWFVGAVSRSTATWKIAMFHHPPVSCLAGETHVSPAMDWPELQHCDLVLCGHGHTSEYLLLRGVPILNVSGAVQPKTATTWRPQGGLAAATVGLFADSSRPLAARLTATSGDLHVELIDMLNGSVRFQRSVRDKGVAAAEWHGQAFPQSDPLAVNAWRSAGRLGRALQATECRVTVDTAGAHGASIRLYADGIAFADLILPPFWETVTLAINEILPQGADISAKVVDGATLYGEQSFGLEVGLIGRWVS